MQAAASPTRMLQLSDVFDVKAVEATYQRLVQVINHQSSEIALLKHQLGELQGQQNTVRTALLQELVPATKQLRQQLISLEETQSVQHQVTQLALEKTRTLKSDLAQTTSNQHQIHQHVLQVQKQTSHSLEQMRAQMVDLHLFTSLQVDFAHVQEQMKRFKQEIDCKMDKVDSSRIDTFLLQMQNFSSSCNSLFDSVHQLELDSKTTMQSLDEMIAKIEANDKQISTINERMACKVNIKQFPNLLEEELQMRMNSRDTRLGQLEHQADCLSSKVLSIENRAELLDLRSKQLSEDLSKRMENQLDLLKEEIDSKASSAECDRVWSEIRQELQCKVWKQEYEVVKSAQRRLIKKTEAMDNRIQLATRFVEWFAKRGEAYEHNFELMENQLSRLALQTQPQRR